MSCCLTLLHTFEIVWMKGGSMMERIITALIVKPNEKPILKEIFNCEDEIAKIIEVDKEMLARAYMKSYYIYFPRFLDGFYCIDNGFFPYTIVLLKKSNHSNLEESQLEFSNMTEKNAFSFLKEINIDADELIDERLLIQNSTNAIDFIINRILHDKKIRAISKALTIFIRNNDFKITMSQIIEHFCEDISIIEHGIKDLIRLNFLVENKIEETKERYFTLSTKCVEEAEHLFKEVINPQLKPVFVSNINPDKNEHYKNKNFSPNTSHHNVTDEVDPLVQDVMEFIIQEQKASVSLIQRKFRVGYARAARIADTLEELGIVSPPDGSKPREVLVNNIEDVQGIKKE